MQLVKSPGISVCKIRFFIIRIMRDIYIRTITGYKSITFKKIFIFNPLTGDGRLSQLPPHHTGHSRFRPRPPNLS